MKIESIKMSGFKNVPDSDFKEYHFSDYPVITGENYTGKTTICEAICWGLLGCNINGNERSDSLLLNNNSRDMLVEIIFQDNNGSLHTLKRSKGINNGIILDDRGIAQKDLFGYTGDKHIFMSIFVPRFFETLCAKDGRELLIGILPPVSREEIFSKLSSDYQEVLEKEPLGDVNRYLTMQRAELKKINEREIFCSGQLEIIKQNLSKQIPESKSFDIGEIEKLETRKEELLSLKTVSQDKAVLIAQKESLRREYENLKTGLERPDLIPGSLCPTCKRVVSDKDIANIISTHKQENQEIQHKIDQLIAKGKEINAKLEAIDNKDQIPKTSMDREMQGEIEKLNIRLQELRRQQEEVTKHNMEVKSLKELVANADKQMKKVKEELKQIMISKELINSKIKAAAKFNAIKAEIQMKVVSSFFDKVTVRLETLVKSTGELKPCFEVLYDNKEVVLLSTSERIRMALEIAKAINGVTGLKLPVFIDNAESITHYEKPDTQVFESRVVIGQNQLQVK